MNAYLKTLLTFFKLSMLILNQIYHLFPKNRILFIVAGATMQTPHRKALQSRTFLL